MTHKKQTLFFKFRMAVTIFFRSRMASSFKVMTSFYSHYICETLALGNTFMQLFTILNGYDVVIESDNA